MLKEGKLTEKIIGLAIEVHKQLGPGLLESAYKQCLSYELNKNNIKFQLEKSVPVKYKGINLECGYRIDILVDDKVIIELKSVSKLTEIHDAQVLTYMRLSGKQIGLLINFNELRLKDGIKRFVL